MKNVFKKTVALVSAMSLMAAGSALSVSASETEIELAVLTKDTTSGEFVKEATAKAGENVEIQIKAVNSEKFQLDTISLRNIINGSEDKYEGTKGLVKVSHSPSSAQYKAKEDIHQFMISAGEPIKLSGNDAVLLTYTFTVPEDAQAGDVFYINWAEDSSYSNYSLKDSTAGEDDIPSSKVGGSIEIVSDEVVTTVVTTEEPIETTTEEEIVTTTEPEETTAAATTTTTAAATTTTTAAATTTTKAVTTTKTPASPATGSSSNGVAALAVTMVAAAGAAIALKKKED